MGLQPPIQHLRKAGELASIEAPRALKNEPCTLFEIKLQPAPLGNGVTPRPMWLHLHTRQPVHARQLNDLRDADFTARHQVGCRTRSQPRVAGRPRPRRS
jgi:hypothetical protein